MIKEIQTEFYIYGTGLYAEVFYSYLKLNNLDNKILGFIVSYSAHSGKSFHGHKVYVFDEAVDFIEGMRVYVAISPDKSVGIKERLNEAGVLEVIQFDEEIYFELETEIFNYYRCSKFEIQNDQVVFWNYWGLGYFDQCKYIAEELHNRNNKISIYWIITNAAIMDFPEWITPVFFGSPGYYEVMNSARILITNVNPPDDGRYKRSGQYYIYTWHGIGPSKRLEWQSPIHNKGKEDEIRSRWNKADIMIAGSDFCHEVYRNSFLYGGVIEDWGYPRNDLLFKEKDFREKINQLYEIDESKKIVLYAPTFRNELMAEGRQDRLQEIYNIDLEMVRKAFEKRFGGSFVILYRFHHYVYRYIDISSYKQKAIDATYYPDMQELLKSVDVLITDYSSSMWDFSLTRKPVFLYYHDAEEYEEKYQGFYVFPDKYPYPKGHTSEELCYAIETFDDDIYQRNLDSWFEKYGTFDDGHASERVANRVLDVMENPSKYVKD